MAAITYADVLETELALVLSFVGPDEHLFICGINRAFDAEYHIPKLEAEDLDNGFEVVRCGTSIKAAFASPSRVWLAVQCDLELNTKHHSAGKFASMDTLMTARQLGLRFNQWVGDGAARSGDLDKLKCLVKDHEYRYLTLQSRSQQSLDALRW